MVSLSFLLNCAGALAVNEQYRLTQYAHSAWRLQDGLFSGTPNVITQTSDGYVWIGTNTGLSRFDGVRFTPWNPPSGASLPDSRIFSLLGTSDGSLWIGTGSNLARWRNGVLTTYPAPRGRIVAVMQDRRGSIWIARSQIADGGGPLCRMDSEGPRCFGERDGLSIPEVTDAAIDAAGDIWIGGDKGLVRWRSDQELPDTTGTARTGPHLLLRAVSGGTGSSAWAAMESPSRPAELAHYTAGSWSNGVPAGLSFRNGEISALFEDRRGALWIGTGNAGILRLDQGRVDRYTERDGLSSDAVANFFEDREGNIWVATSRGLDNFRNLPVISYSMREGLPSDTVSSVFARDNTVWIGALNALTSREDNTWKIIRGAQGLPGLNVTTMLQDAAGTLWLGVDHELFTYREGIFHPVRDANHQPLGTVFAIAEDTRLRNIWVRAGSGLIRMRDGRIAQVIRSGQTAMAYAMAADPRGGVVLGLVNGDLVHVDESGMSTIAADASARHQIRDILVDDDGGLWASTLQELVWARGAERGRLTRENGLPCDGIYGIVRDGRRTLWLYTRCGLVGVDDSELRRWLRDPHSVVEVHTLDATDGVQPGLTSLKPQAVRTADGRLWFANTTILQSFDPGVIRTAASPIPVHIETVIGDRKSYTPSGESVRLPANTRDVEIDYTGLSFVSPRKLAFRYRLSGIDRDWIYAGARRQAFYTDLAPGSYTFRVEASTNPGAWTEADALVNVIIKPTIVQTLAFRLACVAVMLAALWLVYLARLRHLAKQFQERLRERLSERERIARELHDTLLQSLQGLILRVHTATMQVPAGEPARALLEGALDQADHVVTESRARVADLREGSAGLGGLIALIEEDGHELADNTTVSFSLHSEGEARRLHPVVQDELRRVVREALTNAFQHSGADQVSVSLRFAKQELRITISDNGRGIDPSVLNRGGRPGHWGLSGMRERAQKIGARFQLSSRENAGTEITLRISAKLAFRRAQTPSALGHTTST